MNWPLITTIISAAATLVGGLILWNLNKLNENIKLLSDRQNGQDRELGILKDRLSVCKQDCDRQTVSKEDWVRSEGYTRQLLERLSTGMSRMEGSIQIIERIPEICGKIAREVAGHIRKED
jgi:hypothetical protein